MGIHRNMDTGPHPARPHPRLDPPQSHALPTPLETASVTAQIALYDINSFIVLGISHAVCVYFRHGDWRVHWFDLFGGWLCCACVGACALGSDSGAGFWCDWIHHYRNLDLIRGLYMKK